MMFINNGETLLSLDEMTCSYLCHEQLHFLPGHWQAKMYWISWDLQKPNLLENNPNNSRNNIEPQMKSQIKTKNPRGISLFNC